MVAAARVKEIAFRGKTPHGAGFFPPILRAAGHTLYLLGMIADDKITVTDEEAIEELKHAQTHWAARSETDAVSQATRETAEKLGIALGEIITEWKGMADANKTTVLRDYNNRLVQYAADLDRELVGLTDSDPGTSL